MNTLICKTKILTLLSIILLNSCEQKNIGDSVIIRIPNDPEALNPFNHYSFRTTQIFDNIYQRILEVTLPNGELKPILTHGIPIVENADGQFFINLAIREDAYWTSGNPITTEDIEFTLKLLSGNQFENKAIASTISFIEKIEVSNKQDITLFLTSSNQDQVRRLSDFYIFPRHIIDPDDLLSEYEYPLQAKHEDLNDFFESINRLNFLEDAQKITGSQAYEISEWIPGRRVVLNKKLDFWFKGNFDIQYSSNPDQIIFERIDNVNTAISALQSEQINVLDQIPPLDFHQITNSALLKEKYKFYSVATFGFEYIGINSRLSLFEDIYTRQAIAWLIPYDEIIESVLYGYGDRTIGFIQPHQKGLYNSSILPRNYNLDSAKNCLQKAGWRLNDGILQRHKNGITEQLEFSITYAATHVHHESIALIVKDALKKANIRLELASVETNMLASKCRNHEYETIIRGLFGGPDSFNYEYILHSSAAKIGGMNYTAFGTEESDSLIHAINNTQNSELKKNLLMRFQEIVHEQSNILFLYSDNNNIAISNKFENVQISNLKPGYRIASFSLTGDQ